MRVYILGISYHDAMEGTQPQHQLWETTDEKISAMCRGDLAEGGGRRSWKGEPGQGAAGGPGVQEMRCRRASQVPRPCPSGLARSWTQSSCSQDPPPTRSPWRPAQHYESGVPPVVPLTQVGRAAC